MDELKSHPLGDSQQGQDLLHAVQQLTVSINKLLKTFSDADRSIAKEYADMKTVHEHLNELHDENEKIASGIVSVASLLGGLEDQEQQKTPQPQPVPEQPTYNPAPPNPSLPPMDEQPQGLPQPMQAPSTHQGGAIADLLEGQEDDPFAPKNDDPFAAPIKQPDIQEPNYHPAMPPPPPPPKKKRGLF